MATFNELNRAVDQDGHLRGEVFEYARDHYTPLRNIIDDDQPEAFNAMMGMGTHRQQILQGYNMHDPSLVIDNSTNTPARNNRQSNNSEPMPSILKKSYKLFTITLAGSVICAMGAANLDPSPLEEGLKTAAEFGTPTGAIGLAVTGLMDYVRRK